jgi:hypothetical protein
MYCDVLLLLQHGAGVFHLQATLGYASLDMVYHCTQTVGVFFLGDSFY